MLNALRLLSTNETAMWTNLTHRNDHKALCLLIESASGRASLDQLVHQLARPHKTMIERGGGRKELIDVLPLLQQLTYACKQDQRGGASGHSTGPGAPLAI